MEEKTQENTTFVINETAKGSSYETGVSGKRWKFYFNNAIDLVEQIKKLKEAGFEIENTPELKE